GLDRDDPATSVDHLRRYVFSPSPKAFAQADGGFEIFSAPGEGLECVEIARRILALARDGIAFDEIAVLFRSAERYQPMMEDALRRARLPAWFSRGAARPHPAGRAFLALLACAAENYPASRFAEYLSLGQTPKLDAQGAPDPAAVSDEWIGTEDVGQA